MARKSQRGIERTGGRARAWALFFFSAILAAAITPVLAQGPSQSAIPVADGPIPAPPVKPDAGKAKRAYEQGVRAEDQQDWETAYTAFTDAENFAPDEKTYQLRRAIARSHLVQAHVDAAERYAISGRLDQARKELVAANYLDPANTVVRERLRELLADEPQKVQEFEPEPGGEVHLSSATGTRTFDFRGDTQGAYNELARQFGVEAAFDVDLVSHQIHFQAADVDFPTAARLLGDMTKTFWRPLTSKLFFVSEDTPQKRKEYDTSVLRTILLPASETPDQMTEMFRMLREIAGITRSDLDVNSRTITLRASPQALAVATDLINNLEQPTGEMVLEVEILEVDRNFARQLGITPPQTAQVFSINEQEVQEAEASESGLIDVIEQIFGTLNPEVIAFGGGETTFLATLPGASANFGEMLSLVRAGRRILLRAQDGQPATFFVGDRVPVSLSSFSASLTPGSNVTSPSTSTVAPIINYATGNTPNFITSAVLRTDSSIYDLIVANSADNTISVLLGNGDGTFADQVTYPLGTKNDSDPVWIATGDFNDDGILDLAVVNKGSNTISIFLGNGDGTFQPATDIATGHSPVSVVANDFHDTVAGSSLDLAVVNQQDNSITIFQGNGNGTFVTPSNLASIQLPTGYLPAGLGTYDLNADGHSDLVVADSGHNSISVMLGNGNGTFQARTDYPTGNTPVNVAFADFNLDGTEDIAVANSGAPTSSNSGNSVTVYYNQITTSNTPAGTFVSGATGDFSAGNTPSSIVAADINVDGLPDIVVTDQADNAVTALLNAGSELFVSTLPEFPVGTAPTSIVTQDFNADGRPDVATANSGSANATVILNDASIFGEGNLLSETPYPGVEYIDVGLKIKATPRIHPNNDVTLDLNFEVSSLSGQSYNSIPVISNENVVQTVRLRQNETALLAGFFQAQLTNAIVGTPGIADIPAAGLLAQDQNAQQTDQELLFLVTPRMVRLEQKKDRMIYAGQGSLEGAGGASSEPQPKQPAIPEPPGEQPGAPAQPGQPAPQALPPGAVRQ